MMFLLMRNNSSICIVSQKIVRIYALGLLDTLEKITNEHLILQSAVFVDLTDEYQEQRSTSEQSTLEQYTSDQSTLEQYTSEQSTLEQCTSDQSISEESIKALATFGLRNVQEIFY